MRRIVIAAAAGFEAQGMDRILSECDHPNLIGVKNYVTSTPTLRHGK
jgi:hypothetical protein